MRAREFMTRSVVSVRPDTPISEASRLLLGGGFSALPVVGDEESLVGIVSKTDLATGRAGAGSGGRLRPVPLEPGEDPETVGQVMTRAVMALPETAEQSEFFAVMLEHEYRSIPVVSDSRLVGIVCASDMLRTQQRADDEIARDVRDCIRQYTSGRDLWTISVTDGVVKLEGPDSDPAVRIVVGLAEAVPGALRVHAPNARLIGQRRVDTPAEAAQDALTRGPWDHRGLRVLGLEECLDRLRDAPIGRLAFIHDGGPIVLPVNHGMDDMGIVFRTTWGSKLLSVEHGGPVAFEVDGIDERRQTGWSVVATGTASIVYENVDTDRLERLDLRSWARPDEDALWVKILAEDISGREIERVSTATVSGHAGGGRA
jgi:uncharacterized protein